MKPRIVLIVAAFATGCTVLAGAGYYLLSPLFFDRKVSEALPTPVPRQ